MKQLFNKLTAVLLLALIMSVPLAMASGKMEVRIGQRAHLVGNSSELSVEYKWVVKKGNDIIYTESDRNFYYTFLTQGEYDVNLTAKSRKGIEAATIHVLAGERYRRISEGTEGEGDLIVVMPFRLNLETLPYRTAEGRLTLFGPGKVYFSLENSFGDILEYRIDKNIFEDSDGNGTANDDIDNADDDSYLTGQPWITDYTPGDSSKIVAEVTLVELTGKKIKEQVEIVFDERDESGEVVATFDTVPAAQPEDKLIHLYNDPHRVAFYSARSSGKVLEYRIDKNIFEDSDGDGDPKNDIDNLNDISFKTGSVWEMQYTKTDEQIIAQLIVVGEGGKGSRVQKGIVFGDKPLPPAPTLEEIQAEGGIRLVSDKDFVIKGDPITFTVQGLSLGLENYTFAWDYDGDLVVDKETEGENSTIHIYELPGLFEAKVVITDAEGNTADYSLEVISKDTEVTKADFTFTMEGNAVRFENFSTVSTSLASKSLTYQWSFGDTDEVSYESQKNQIDLSSPTYTYSKAGTYLVTLTVVDADRVTDSKSQEIEILQDMVDSEVPVIETSEEGEGENIFVKFFKILLYLVLIVLTLIILIVGGFLAFLKVQHPELTFEELVDELKAKILTMLGVHEEGGHPLEAPEGGAQPPMPEAEAHAEEPPVASVPPVVEPSVEPEVPVEPAKESMPPPAAEAGPTPEWLKGTEVIEGEVEEEASAVEPETPKADVPEQPVTPVESKKPSDDDKTPPSEPLVGGESADKSESSSTQPPVPDSEAPAGESVKSPSPDGEAPDSEKGPTPDWLKDV